MTGFETEKPRFFKIILETTIFNKRLMLPTTFVRNHYLKSVSSKSSPTTATLTIPNGLTWKVDVVVNASTTTTNDDHGGGPEEVWLQGQGWEEFVTSHSLEHGHFIVFQYEGNSNFSVLVFDISASEIDYLVPLKRKEEAEFKDRDDDDDLSMEIKLNPDFGSLSKPGKRGRRNLEISNSFTAVIKKKHDKRHLLNIPRAFARGLMLKDQNLKLEVVAADDNYIYSNKEQQCWVVEAKKVRTRNEMFISGGWSKFVGDNSLKDGDTCKFKMIRVGTTPQVLQVFITKK